ncbi:MAG: EAL domain-containing protein [Planctomycetota bacterium]
MSREAKTPDHTPTTTTTPTLTRLLDATRCRVDAPFAEAAGRVLAACTAEIGADRALLIETTAERGVAWAAAHGDGRVVHEDQLPDTELPDRDLWVGALIDGGAADHDASIARPFVLDQRVIGVLLFAWDRPPEAPLGEAPRRVVAACADWVSAEWARRVHERRAAELAEQRQRTVLNSTTNGLFDWDLVTNRVDYSPRWRQMLGYSDEQPVHRPDDWFNLVESSDLAQLEADLAMCLAGQTTSLKNQHRLTTPDGQTRWVLCRGELVLDDDGEPVRLIGSLSDTTEFKLAEEKLRHAAEHDKLTDLPNRATLHVRLAQAIRRHKLTGGRRRYAALFLDFDRFKVVNDSLGHDAGDQLLIQIAQRLREQVRTADTAARIGGDEFVLLLEEVEDFNAVIRVAERLLDVFARPFDLDGHEVTSTASIGIVSGDLGYEGPDDVIRDADLAMYHAKKLGKARYCVFDQRMQDESIKRLVLERELRHAIGSDQLFMTYQPIFSVVDGNVTGFEALVRWQHPELGVVRPDHFIRVAEETGLVVPLGQWVLERTCRDLLHIRRARPGLTFTMNVNLSRRQLVQPGLVGMIRDTLARFGVDPQDIRLEITESVIMDRRADLTPVLAELRALGCELAMDDFGTGHSSLSCLHEFPIDILKIDRSFIQSLEKHIEFAAVIQAIVTLAHTLGMAVVAEGIETVEQLGVLQALECDRLQGYLFARPLPLDELTAYLAEPTPLLKSA